MFVIGYETCTDPKVYFGVISAWQHLRDGFLITDKVNGQARLRQPIPIACDRHVTRVAQRKVDIRKADRVAVAQVELGVTIDANGIYAVVVPVAGDGQVAGQSIIQRHIGETCCVGILQEDHAIARAEDAGGVRAVSVPIACHAHIAHIPQIKNHLPARSVLRFRNWNCPVEGL